jgi:hypothetical protein
VFCSCRDQRKNTVEIVVAAAAVVVVDKRTSEKKLEMLWMESETTEDW